MTVTITRLLCPCCGAEMDEITHGPASNDYSMALIGNDGRLAHAKASPECTQRRDWFRGWNTETRVEREFYLQNVHGGCVGNCPMWWHKTNSGYTYRLSDAKRMLRKEVEEIISSTRGSHLWEAYDCDVIDSLAFKVVDVQDMTGVEPEMKS